MTTTERDYVFGPLPSRDLGWNSGINNIPIKICDDSRVYCPSDVTSKIQTKRKEYPR